MRNSQPILLIEDDPADTIIVKRAFNELEVTNPLVHSPDGEEGLEYLRSEGNKKPCIILLDSNMPKMNGMEFLKVVKANNVLKKIPVLALTACGEEQHIVESFKLGVAGYILKPLDYRKFVEAIRIIHLYWTLSELPNVQDATSI